MAFDSDERPMAREGGTHAVKLDLSKNLDEGDTITSASLTELTSSDLTVGTVTVGAEETTILKTKVAAGKWIIALVSGHLASTATYRLKCTFSTADGVTDHSPLEDYVFDVVS